VSDIGPEAASNDAAPGWVVHGVELGLEDLCDVVQDPFLLERVVRTVNCVLLHLLRHVCKLDDGVLGLYLVTLDLC
jgi:hypothetical protein